MRCKITCECKDRRSYCMICQAIRRCSEVHKLSGNEIGSSSRAASNIKDFKSPVVA
jgi:hypothetical protein